MTGMTGMTGAGPPPGSGQPVDVAGFGRLAAQLGDGSDQPPRFRWGVEATPSPPVGPPPAPTVGAPAYGQPAFPTAPQPAPLSGYATDRPQPAVPHPYTGPPADERSVLAVVVLTFFTLGLYQVFWHARANREMHEFDLGMTARPGRSAAAIMLVWLVGFLATAVGAARVIVHQANVSLSFDPHLSPDQGLYLLPAVVAVPILELFVPLSLIALVMTFERLRMVEALSGLPTDQQTKPARMVWWMLVPVLGATIALARAQVRLNGTWERARGQTESSWGFGYGR